MFIKNLDNYKEELDNIRKDVNEFALKFEFIE